MSTRPDPTATLAAQRARIADLEAALTREVAISLAECAWRDAALRFARTAFADHPAARDPAWQGALARLAAEEAEVEALVARAMAIVDRVLAEARRT